MAPPHPPSTAASPPSQGSAAEFQSTERAAALNIPEPPPTPETPLAAPPRPPPSPSAAPPAPLIAKEDYGSGPVPWGVYAAYARALGPYLAAFGALAVAAEASRVGVDLWLSRCAAGPGARGGGAWGLALGLALLGGGSAALTLGRGLAIVEGCSTASALLHDRMYARVTRAPMTFFQTTPVGRLMTRFSKVQCGGGGGGWARGACEGKGPQRRLGRRLEGVAEAVGGGYCRLQMPMRLALGARGTVAGHGLGALEGGVPPPLPMHRWGWGHCTFFPS